MCSTSGEGEQGGGLSNIAKSFGGKMAISAIVGGTASRLGGGKFANGAVSAAFVHMYNAMGHVTRKRISELNVKIQDSVKNFINDVEAKLGIRLRITQGYRSIKNTKCSLCSRKDGTW